MLLFRIHAKHSAYSTACRGNHKTGESTQRERPAACNKAYGKKALNMDIVRIDGYNDLLPYVNGEVTYNYLGSVAL